MPIPKPKKNENKKEFLERCMGDDVMNEEYPDEKQRYAICQTQWKDKDKNSLDNEIEMRMFESMEFRDNGDSKPPQIVGYAAVFNKLSLDLGGFRELVKPGAFTRTLKDMESGKRVVNSLFNHDPNWLLATTANGSLRLKEDEKGLYVEMEPIITTMNGHPINLIRAKAVRGMSFKFSVRPNGRDSWEFTKGQEPIRTLEDVDLYDASPVVEPAYPQTSVKVRDYLKAIREAGENPDEQSALERGRAASLEILKAKLDIAEIS